MWLYFLQQYNNTVYMKKYDNIFTLFFLATIGSEKAKNGKAKFRKPFLYVSIFFCPWTIWKKEKKNILLKKFMLIDDDISQIHPVPRVSCIYSSDTASKGLNPAAEIL